jgi:hypothetical protein
MRQWRLVVIGVLLFALGASLASCGKGLSRGEAARILRASDVAQPLAVKLMGHVQPNGVTQHALPSTYGIADNDAQIAELTRAGYWRLAINTPAYKVVEFLPAAQPFLGRPPKSKWDLFPMACDVGLRLGDVKDVVVTGIQKGSDSHCTVSFDIIYEPSTPFGKAFLTPENLTSHGTATLVLWDDGWRLEE